MENIFTYGTLQDLDIQLNIVGRALGEGSADTLLDYKMAKLPGILRSYNILVPQTGSTIEGIVYEVTEQELAKIDEYEGDAYLRVNANLVSKKQAWVYRNNPDSPYQSKIVFDDDSID